MMREAERQAIRAAAALVHTGDRSGALRILRDLAREPSGLDVRRMALARRLALAAAQLLLWDTWPDETFECPAHGPTRYRACISRQRQTEVEVARQRHGREADGGASSSPRKRGVAPTYVSCDTRRCPLGRCIREHFGDNDGRTSVVLTLHERRT